MRLNLNWFFYLFSPLEQFEISSYNTSLNYITTYPIELLENLYSISYNPETLYTFFDLILILVILKSFQLFIKNDGFIFLYIFILVLLTCFNLYSFTDFVLYNESFGIDSMYLVPSDLEYFFSTHPSFIAHYIWTPLSWFYYLPNLIETLNNSWDNMYVGSLTSSDQPSYFYYEKFIPNIVIYAKVLVAYSWYLGYLFYKEVPLDAYSLNASSDAVSKIKSVSAEWTTKSIEWSNLFEDSNYIFLINNVLPKYSLYLDQVKMVLLDETKNKLSLRFMYDDLNELGTTLMLPNEGFSWMIFLIIIVGIFLATNPHLLELKNFNETTIEKLFQNESLKQVTVSSCETCEKGPIDYTQSWVTFIENHLSVGGFNAILHELVSTAHKVFPQLFMIDALTITHMLKNEDTLELYFYSNDETFYNLFDSSFDLNKLVAKEENNFFFVTLNTSFINMYSIFFCFVFILLIIYLIFNKSLSNNSNTIIPNIYQVFGETIYKVSLNLFYSVLGKHLSHPEFFIKINTIFLFLIISNVQGMIPYMSTLTSALTNTFFIALALFINIIITLLDKKGANYFLNLFMPSGCPIFLVLLLIPIEVISYSFRVVSLSVRLFANMMAGHTLLKVIVGFSWIIVFIGNTSLINLFPIIILFILTLLEFGVALIQAYIFTILSCIYLRDIFQGH